MSIIDLKTISKSDKPIFDKFFQIRRYENSHLNFTNLYMWARPFDIRFAIENEVLYMCSRWDDQKFALQPIGRDELMPAAVEKIIDCGAKKLIGLEKFFVDILDSIPNRTFEIERDDKNFDYVYLAEDLINLSGRKYHSKKNHLNSFWKAYPTAQYLEITPEVIEQCREELKRWYEVRSEENENPDFLELERNAICEIFDNFSDFKLKGGALHLGGKIIAFTFGEQINSDTAVIHVEKADPEIRGAYAAINQAFVENAWSSMTYINREEDMGLAGLRQAKESYRPTKLIEKFNATLV